MPPRELSTDLRHNLFLAIKEALHNVVKHAQASEVWLRIVPSETALDVSIEDNGRGLGDISAKQLRNGMKNMRKRLSEVRGQFEIAPGAEGGTTVQLIVPIARPKP